MEGQKNRNCIMKIKIKQVLNNLMINNHKYKQIKIKINNKWKTRNLKMNKIRLFLKMKLIINKIKQNQINKTKKKKQKKKAKNQRSQSNQKFPKTSI